jgi:pimeloyl-ACP methyl ester carboxylesterase
MAGAAIVLVHGNPETPIIWEPLVAELTRRDPDRVIATPHLPGFGRPRPDGFGATKEEYAAWLIDEVEAVVADHGPVDLVGHDWGGGLAMRLVATRPDLVRTWACDVLGLFHPEYVWHDFAQIWQTPGAGEQYFEQSLATPLDDRLAGYEAIGIPRPIGERLLAVSDATMGECVLALYRSAAQPAMAAWGRELAPAATRPGLALIAPHDPFVRGDDLGTAVAHQLGARIAHLAGQGHWWMLGDPVGGAAVLEEFWASVPR